MIRLFLNSLKDGKFSDGTGESSATRLKRIEEKYFPHLRKSPILTNKGDNDTIKLPDIYIGRSVGAKARDFVVFDGENEYRVVEGTHIQNIVAFAGYGCTKSLHFLTLERLMEYGGNRRKWRRCKGIALLDDNGIYRKADIHWFEKPR